MFGQAPVLVELVVEAFGDDAAVADHHGGIVDQGSGQQFGQLREGANVLTQAVERGAVGVAGKARLECRKGIEGVTQSCQVPRAGTVEGHPGQNAFDVTDRLEVVAQRLMAVMVEQQADGRLAPHDLLAITQRSIEPALEQA